MKRFLKKLGEPFLKKEKYISWEHLNNRFGTFFKDSLLQEQYCKDGYVVLKNIALSILPYLKEEASKFQINNTSPFLYSSMILESEESIRLHGRLREAFSNTIGSQYFNNYQLYSATFLIKPAHNQSEMYLHQDWSFTNEWKHSSATVWIPLQDVNIENGCVFLLPATHRIRYNFRSHTLPTSILKRDKELEPYIQPVEINEGDVLIFNPAVFHGSYPNQTSLNRISFAITIMNDFAPFIYTDYVNDKSIRLLYLEKDALIKDLTTIVEKNQLATHLKEESLDYQHAPITKQEVLNFLKLLSRN